MMAAALLDRGDCLLHGRHHQLDHECREAIRLWYDRHYPGAPLGQDLLLVTQVRLYQQAYQDAVAQSAQALGHCPHCARLGEACAECER
ncbi:hypothetical protein [Nocardiopsis dassonvillei]|uniref:hypothetical protein n=1 Tax=Nocardiopsis dassonvillei TaxID=2014 RepID=UPI00362D884F